MNEKILAKIDEIIKSFKESPQLFDDNVWRCYTKCKQVIYKAEEDQIIPWDCNVYDTYINYITKKLDI